MDHPDGDETTPAATAERASAQRKPTADSTPALQSPPPYWNSHTRSQSNISIQSNNLGRPTPIRLEDHSDETDDQGRHCWAKHVSIDDYIIVSGPTGIGAYVLWNCTVETLKGAPFTIRKRFSEFDKLRSDLVDAFPHAEASIPPLPRKSVISRFRAKFLEHRKTGLSHFLNCILLNPEFSGSPILHDFIFS